MTWMAPEVTECWLQSLLLLSYYLHVDKGKKFGGGGGKQHYVLLGVLIDRLPPPGVSSNGSLARCALCLRHIITVICQKSIIIVALCFLFP